MTSPQLPRRRVLQGLAAGAGLAALGGLTEACSSSSAPSQAAPTTAAARPTTTTTTRPAPVKLLGPGDRPDPTRPEGIDMMPQVEHIVIYMQENHSFDNYFGMLGRGDGFTLDAAGRPTNSNPDRSGKPVRVFHEANTANTGSTAGQNWDNTRLEIDHGKADGFARLEPLAMGYYDGTDLPYYYGLAKQFVLCDRWFTSAPGQTYPNRRFLQAATSVGITSTTISEITATPSAPNGVIWDRLHDHGISFNDYAFDIADLLLFPTSYAKYKGQIRKIGDFLTDAKNGTLPQVSIVSPGTTDFSEENLDIQRGEAYSHLLIDAVMQGKAWDKTVIFFMYDEHGGWYDHVPPPAAIAPDDIKPRLKPGDTTVGGFDQYGFRVPAMVISPFAKQNYVSHVVHDHTSVLKFIETKFNLGALTKRDANASNLLDTLDFEAAAFRQPPVLPAPALPGAKSTFEPNGAPLPTPLPAT